MEKSKITVGREFYEAANLFHREVLPQIKKLKYLSIIAHSGITGEDPYWTEELYSCLSSGLSYILEDIIEKIEGYETQIHKLHDLHVERTKKGEIIDPLGKIGPGKEKERRSETIEMLKDMLEKENELLKHEKAPETEGKEA